MRISRRDLLLALPLAGAAAGCRLSWPTDELARRLTAGAVRRHRGPWVRIGEAYLRAHPDEAAVGFLTRRLAGRLGWRALHRPERLRERLRQRVEDDFRSRSTVPVEGWVLSRTAARMAALVSLYPPPA